MQNLYFIPNLIFLKYKQLTNDEISLKVLTPDKYFNIF